MDAQLNYGASFNFSLSKTNPSYTGDALVVRRACDNATVNIGYTACGVLDTMTLNAFAGLQVLPLTSITSTAATAYSLRRLNCAYTGSAIKIISTAAGTPTLDVGFTVYGDLDTTAMKLFIGTNSAYITTWFDQSGNGRDAFTTITGTNQPRIMLAGVIERQGSRPAIRFLGGNGTGRGFATTNLNIYGTAACYNGVVKVNTDVSYNTFVNQTDANIPGPIDHYNGTVVIGDGSTYSFYYPSQTLNASFANGIWTYQASGVTAGNIKMWHNSVNILTASGNSNAYGGVNRPLYIGTRNDFLTSLDGWISEVVTFSALPSDIDRNFLEWTQTQYYGITSGVGLGTLPSGNLPTAFVNTWYDQSGNNRNITQTTNSSQPRIINTGVVEKLNGLPALTFNGSSQYLSASDAGLPTGNLFISAITRANTAASYGSILHYGTNGPGNAVFATFGTDGNMGSNAMSVSQYGDALGIAGSNSTNIIYSAGRTTTSYTLVRNGGSLSNKVMSTNTSLYGAAGLSIGNYNPSLGGGYLNGSISEVCLFPSSFSQSRRILLESNRSSYTNISVANSQYTPPATGSYHLYVNGIGREAIADTVLGTRVTVGMGFRSGTTAGADFLQNDGDYLTCGINCPVGPGTSVLDLPATIVQRWRNDWFVNKSDVGTSGGTVKIYFDFSDYGYTGGLMPGLVTNYELLTRNAPVGVFSIVPVTGKAVVGDRVEFELDANTIVKNNYYTIGTKQMNVSPLPVELVNFTAEPENNNVRLKWITASETNNDYFTIEKSKNALDFIPVKNIMSKAANGNSTSALHYLEVDEKPYYGTSYYRLKQTDRNKKTSYSSIVDVHFGQSSLNGISVFPNPNSGEFTLSINGSYQPDTKVELTMMDALGRIVYQKTILLSTKTNSFEIIPEQKPAKGIYMLSCQVSGEYFTKKLVVE